MRNVRRLDQECCQRIPSYLEDEGLVKLVTGSTVLMTQEGMHFYEVAEGIPTGDDFEGIELD